MSITWGKSAVRQFIILPLLAMTGCATAGPGSVQSADPSVVTWTRLYCTPDNESHFETRSAPLEQINFAPPASPIFIGGGGPATKVVFGGFDRGCFDHYRGWSDQQEIDQRGQGRADAGGDQRVVGADVGLRIER